MKRPAGFIAPRRLWLGKLAPRRPLPKGQRRGAVTHVAMIANLERVQPKLPQIFLCNERVVPAWALKSSDLCKPNVVEFWREKSGWNNVAKMKRILEKIAGAMVEFADLQAIVLLDCAPCHVHPEVAAVAEELGLWLAVTPAKLTFLLQPLDVFAFSPYKSCLAKLFAAREKPDGELGVVEWMQCLCDAARKFWCSRKWRPAFELTGILSTRQALSLELQHLNVSRHAAAPLLPPSQESVEAIFPKGKVVPYVSLFWSPANLDPPLLT